MCKEGMLKSYGLILYSPMKEGVTRDHTIVYGNMVHRAKWRVEVLQGMNLPSLDLSLVGSMHFLHVVEIKDVVGWGGVA